MRIRPPLYSKLKKSDMRWIMLLQGISFQWTWMKEMSMLALIAAFRRQGDLRFISRLLLDLTRQRFTVYWNLFCENKGDFEMQRLTSSHDEQTSTGIRSSCRSTGST